MRMARSRAASERASAAVLGAALLLGAAGASAAPGKVLSASATRAYLDRGAADGLAVGARVALTRAGEAAGECEVEEVSEHHARCKGAGLRPGDRFEAAAKSTGSRPAAVEPMSAPPTAAELKARNAALSAAPVPKVAFAGASGTSPAAGLNLHSEAAWTHTSWLSSGGAGFHDERVDLAIRGLEIAGGFRVWADLSLVQYESRPDNARYRPGGSTFLYVRELAVVQREVGNPYAVAAGRVRPWHAPGIPVLDGAQAGWRSRSGTAEVGVFGGELPDVKTINFQKAYLAGAYWSVDHFGAVGDAVRVVRHEGRLSVAGGADFETRLEAEAAVQAAFWRSVDAGLSVRVAYASARGATLDGFRADFGLRPVDTLRIFGGYRFEGIHDVELAAVDPHYRGAGQHADLTASWDVLPALTLGASGGFAHDAEVGRARGYVGPELGLPTLFGAHGGLALGYAEEFGWTGGRTGWLQAILLPSARWRVLARASYFQDVPSGAASGTHEVGLAASLDAPLVSWLSLRLSLAGRVGLDALEAGPALGFVGSLGLRGQL
ncbi:MAG TPA: hypothetical protein VGK67_35090 [Myxococcales bacterium]|jgi:hypothetical protein